MIKMWNAGRRVSLKKFLLYSKNRWEGIVFAMKIKQDLSFEIQIIEFITQIDYEQRKIEINRNIQICFWESLIWYSVFTKRNISRSIKYLLTKEHKKDTNVYNVRVLKMLKKRVLIKESTPETPININITFCPRRSRGFLMIFKVLRNMGIM